MAPDARRSSRPDSSWGDTWEAPPQDRRTRIMARWGRLLLSRRVAGGLLCMSLLVLLGAPLALGTAGGTPEPAQAAPTSAPKVTGPASRLYPSGPPTVDCDDLEQRYRNPTVCLTLNSPSADPRVSTSKTSTSASDASPSRTPTSSARPCDGEDCLPNPTATKPGEAPGPPGQGGGGEDDECGTFDIGCHIREGVDALFRGIVESALNPLLKFLSDTLLTTPTLDELPQVAPLWDNSWQILLAAYSTLVLVGGLLVMGHETLQTQYTAKQIAPRIVVGFLAGFLSLFVADKLIRLANGLSAALLGGGLDAGSAGTALGDMVSGALSGGGLFLLLLGLALAVMLVALLITYVIRVAITVVLLIGAPLALMCHALPQTEGVARWWWRALFGVLAIQVAQSLTLIVALKIFFAPSGWTPFGPQPSGLVNLLVALALIYILLKIPFWILSATQVTRGRSFVGSMAKAFVAYKTLGVLGGRTGAATAASGVGTPGKNTARTGTAGTSGGQAPQSPPPPIHHPRPRPRSEPPAGPHTPAVSEPAPPIEDTVWGRGGTAHTTESAHQRAPQRRQGHPSPGRAPAPRAATPALPAAAQRARDGAHRAWRPLAGSGDWRPAAPGASSAMVATPIEDTVRATGNRPHAPSHGGERAPTPPASARAQRLRARAEERFVNDPPKPVTFKANRPARPQRRQPKPPPRQGGLQ